MLKKESLGQRAARDSYWNILSIIFSRVGAIIFTAIIARILLPAGFGIYNLATSVALLFMTFADVGINHAMVRFVSAESVKNKKKAAAYFRYTFNIKLKLLIISSLLLILLSYPLSIYAFKNKLLFIPFILSAVYTLFIGISTFFESLFFIFSNVKYIAIKEILLQATRILLVLLIPLIFSYTFFVSGTLFVAIISVLIVLLFVRFYSKKLAPDLFKKEGVLIDKKRVMKFLFFVILTNISAIFFSYIDIVMIGLFLPVEYVGYYRAAFLLIISALGLFGLTNIFLPALAKVKKQQILEVFSRIIKYSMILAIPTMVGILSLSKYLLKAFYGAPFIVATLPLYFLLPLMVITTIVGNLQTLFSAREKPQFFTKITVFVTILNIILNFILIKSLLKYSALWAIAGAAIATLTSWSVYLIGALRISKREFNFSLNLGAIIKPLIASAVMGLFLLAFNYYTSDMNLIKGAIEVFIGAVIYFAALFLVGGANKGDFKLFFNAFKNILKKN